MGDLHLTVASWDEREDLVIELTFEDGTRIEEWGLVTYDEVAGKPVIDLYPRSGGGERRFDLDELNAVLARAKTRIVEVAGPLSAGDSETDQSDATAASHAAASSATRLRYPPAHQAARPRSI